MAFSSPLRAHEKPHAPWRRAQRTAIRALRSTLRMEPLEPRLLLDGDGILQGADLHLTLSFAPDGADVAGTSNQLAATFDALAPRSDWQDAILRAFQTWAAETNADVGLVADSGDPFGTPGRSQRDDRFGDIRIGAVAMSPEVGAVSVPVDGAVTGTWFADVVFNIDFEYQTIDDIFAVALHEAGNVFGLEDNDDPNSPLYSGAAPTGLPPTPADLAALRDLHGQRAPDLNEFPDDDQGGGPAENNDSIDEATRLKLVENEEGPEGSAPSILYGDITTLADRDFFEIRAPDEYAGPVTFQVRSSGMSLLAPLVTIYDANEEVVDQLASTSTRGDRFSYTLPAAGSDARYYLEITGDGSTSYGIGGYSVAVLFDDVNEVDQATIDRLAGGQFRFLDRDDFEEFFDGDDNDYFEIDLNSNDSIAAATELETATGYVEGTRYEKLGSIDNEVDVDFYIVKTPNFSGSPSGSMTLDLKSLDAGGLIPRATVFDEDGQPLPARILANGGGDYILQVDAVESEKDYWLGIQADDSSGPFHAGNYELIVTFPDQPTVLTAMSSGIVGDGVTQSVHTVYLGRPQLFHLALEVNPTNVSSPTIVVATIRDELGQSVYQIAARPGDTRSREAILLQSGTYTVEVVPRTLDGSVPPELSYALLGVSISDLFVGDPEDPTPHPFACAEPELEGLFCYPGDFISTDPFLWDAFIDSLTTPPDPIDLTELIANLIGDWWSWVWDSVGVNGPPLALSDSTQVEINSPNSSQTTAFSTFIEPTGSLLDNDVDPEGGAVVAVKKSDPLHGTLTLNLDGTFVYTPNAGFAGRDSFTYVAYDFVQESAVASVVLIVGESGDFDAGGNVNGRDFLTWQRGAGRIGGARLPDGDSNFDGNVDALDLGVWQQQYQAAEVQMFSGGDSDGDGDYDGVDFLAWQRGVGLALGATAADGDANGDGIVDGDDRAEWEARFGLGVGAAGDAAAVAAAGLSPPASQDAAWLGVAYQSFRAAERASEADTLPRLAGPPADDANDHRRRTARSTPSAPTLPLRLPNTSQTDAVRHSVVRDRAFQTIQLTELSALKISQRSLR